MTPRLARSLIKLKLAAQRSASLMCVKRGRPSIL